MIVNSYPHVWFQTDVAQLLTGKLDLYAYKHFTATLMTHWQPKAW